MENVITPNINTIKNKPTPTPAKLFLDNYKNIVEEYIIKHLEYSPITIIKNHFDENEAQMIINIFNDTNNLEFITKLNKWISTLDEDSKNKLNYLKDKRSHYTMFRQMVINWTLEYAILDYVNHITEKIYNTKLLQYTDGDNYNKTIFNNNFYYRDLDYKTTNNIYFELQDHPYAYNPTNPAIKLKPWKLKKIANQYPAFLIQLYLKTPTVIIIDPLQFIPYWEITTISGKPAIHINITEQQINTLQQEEIIPKTAFIKTTIHDLPTQLYNLSKKYKHLKKNQLYNTTHSKMIHKLIGEMINNTTNNQTTTNTTTLNKNLNKNFIYLK